MRPRYLLLLLSLLLSAPILLQAQQRVAATPPMGWNSWDSFGLTITQSEFEHEAGYMHQHLQKYGWQYMVIDEGWFARYPNRKGIPRKVQGYDISPNGLYLPAPHRFPGGLKAVADYVTLTAAEHGLAYAIRRFFP